MNYKHRKERKNARKRMKFFRIDRETLERSSKSRKKKMNALKNDEACLIDIYSTQKVTENKKAMKFKR